MPSTAGPTTQTGPLLDPVLKPLYDAYFTIKKARDERGPLDLDLPERKILLKPDGYGRSRHRSAAPRRAPADRGIHDPRQCRGGRNAGARQRRR